MRLSIALFLLFVSFLSASAQDGKNQDSSSTSFGKGLINKVAEDSTWYTKVSFRFQSQYEGTYVDLESSSDEPQYSDRFFVRRARIKGDGWATKSQRLKYKFEYDVHNGFVLDAVVKWVFDKNRNWELWFGQTKLPGNMERVISSQKLQFVDRSLLNSSFTLDRDAGVQLRGKHKLSENFLIEEKFAISQGEGLNQKGQSQGYGYTARLELYPFGKFKDVYVSSDLKRHDNLLLMIGATYDFNNKALREKGQRGSYLDSRLPTRDLQTLFLDAHLKYKGFSWMVEYAERNTGDESPIVVKNMVSDIGEISTIFDSYFTGASLNTTLGYLMPSNWEIAGRFTTLTPDSRLSSKSTNEYGLAVSRYIVGHNLKVQSDIHLIQEEGSADAVMFRVQTEFNF